MTTRRSLDLKWTKKDKNAEEKKKTEDLVRNSTILLSKLRDIIEEELLLNQKVSSSDYDTGSWAYKQAHRNGKTEALSQLLKLFNFLDQRT